MKVEEPNTETVTAAPVPRSKRWLVPALVLGLLVAVGAVAYVISTWWMRAVPAVNIPLPEPAMKFDGDQSYRYLVDICKLGPRISATPAMYEQQRILTQHFEKLGAKVVLQQFTASQPSLRGRTFECTNLIVHWHPDAKRRVLVGCHYDTRPIADREPVFRNRGGEFLGANDGASGVALLMELGRQMPNLEFNVGVDFVFFDAEEYIFDTRRDKYFIGSEGFVKAYKAQSDFSYDAVVVVDMVADKDQQLHPDQRSSVQAGPLVHEVWEIARELGIQAFDPSPKYDILDDHIAFLKEDIPALVIIDFDYPHWHRLSDTPEQCSGESLKAVGTVVGEWLVRRK